MFIQAGIPCKWTNDSQCFLLEHFDTIQNSPSHIYQSALPFLPSSSWLHECYNVELSFSVKVVKGLPAKWGRCFRTISLDYHPWTLSYWKNTIAVGLNHDDIIIFNTVTGSQTAVLHGHTDRVNSLTFSPDGKSLISGSDDNTIKLWDMQTGGVVKTFYGHTQRVWSVSISADCTRIASGSGDKTIHLWDIQTGECYHMIKQQDVVYQVSFSPTDPQHLLSIAGNKVWHWDTNGHQIPPFYGGSHINFSLDRTQVVSCSGVVVTVQNFDSRATVTQFHMANEDAHRCYFSPDSKHVVVAAGTTIYVWDITSSDPHLVETFIGHISPVTSLIFSSPTSFISVSIDQSIKFWQIGASPMALVETNPESFPLTSVKSITLQAKDGIAIISDCDGVVRTWDISTGLCKASFQTPAKAYHNRDVQLIDGRLVFVWYEDNICIQDVEQGRLLWAVGGPGYNVEDLRISGDGSRVFCLDESFIIAWSMQIGEVVGKVEVEGSTFLGSLIVDGSRVWVHYPESEYQGWDFGTLGSSPVQLSTIPPTRLPLNNTKLWDTSLSRIKDTASGNVVFQLSGRFANPVCVQCDGCYLVAGYSSGDVLILDFNHVFLQ